MVGFFLCAMSIHRLSVSISPFVISPPPVRSFFSGGSDGALYWSGEGGSFFFISPACLVLFLRLFDRRLILLRGRRLLGRQADRCGRKRQKTCRDRYRENHPEPVVITHIALL